MRLLFLHGYAGSLAAEEAQGILYRVKLLYEAYAAAGVEVLIASPDDRRFDLSSCGSIVHVPLGNGRKGLAGVGCHRARLASLVASLQPSAVIADMTASPMLICACRRVPIVLRLEWPWAEVARLEDGRVEWACKRALELWSLRTANALSASTPALESWGRRHCRGATAVIPNFVMPEFFLDGDSQRHPGQRLRLLAVGRLVPLKRHDLLLSAIALQPASSRPRLTVVGDGPLRHRLARQADELDVDVDFRGAVSHHDVVGCMRDSDVLVHTSVREGSPRVIAEAFAAGLPVATVRWPGAQWFSGLRDERALTVSAAPRALAAEFSQMTRSTARRQMRNRAARARRWASLHFSVDSHVARTLAFVGDLRVDTSRRSRRQILEGHLDTA